MLMLLSRLRLFCRWAPSLSACSIYFCLLWQTIACFECTGNINFVSYIACSHATLSTLTTAQHHYSITFFQLEETEFILLLMKMWVSSVLLELKNLISLFSLPSVFTFISLIFSYRENFVKRILTPLWGFWRMAVTDEDGGVELKVCLW